MKYLKTILFYLILPMLAFVACNDDDAETKDKVDLVLSKSEITIPQAGEAAVFYVKSNVVWQLSGIPDWCSVTPTSGLADETTKVTVTVGQNTTDNERTAQLIVAGGTVEKTLTVTQELNFLVTKTLYQAKPEGEVINATLKSDGTQYEVVLNNSWIARSAATRAVSDKTEFFAIDANYTGKKRTGSVTLKMKDKDEVITFEQEAMSIPAADRTGMESDALVLAAKMKIGWNLGNTLEASGNETAWGNPKTSQEIIDMVKDAGFNAIRIPCNWHNGYIEDETTCQIKTEWMERVKEVVDYCVNRDLYVILNIHWDGGWLEENPTYAMQEELNRKQTLLWTQIANRFIGYDEHLLFAGTNEVHMKSVYDDSKVTAENHEVQQSFNQTFVNAVRTTGGRNAYRNLIVQSYNTQINFAVSHLKMPTDTQNDRLMMEVHFYDPYDYTIGNNIHYWGQPYKDQGFTVDGWGQEDHVDSSFANIKKNFVDKGIPTIIGEYAANRHSMTDQNMIDSRVYWLEYITRNAKNNGMVPFYWDNGGLNGDPDVNQCAIFDRKQLKIVDQPALDAIMRAAEAGVYPF